MKLVAARTVEEGADNDTETIVVPQAQFDYLSRVGSELNSAMPMAFAGAHVIRTLLERFEETGIDLTEATSESELTRIAAHGLRARSRATRTRD